MDIARLFASPASPGSPQTRRRRPLSSASSVCYLLAAGAHPAPKNWFSNDLAVPPSEISSSSWWLARRLFLACWSVFSASNPTLLLAPADDFSIFLPPATDPSVKLVMLRAGLSLFSLATLLQTGSAFLAPPSRLPLSRLFATTTSPLSDKMTDTGDNGEVLEPQGTHHGWYSLQPLIEAGKWSSNPGSYL